MNIFELKNIKLNNNFGATFLALSILLYPFLFIWQCGDLTDTGFFVLNYQNFFEKLKLGNTNSLFFISDLIGAIWFKLFPTSGIIGFKFLYLVFFYLIISISYLLLKNLTTKKNLLLLGIFCAISFSERTTMFIFSYDIASWLFLIISSYFIIKGLNSKKILSFYFSGIFFAISCLCRFPNIVLIALLPITLLYIRFYREKNTTYLHLLMFIKEYSLFIIGFMSAIALFWGLLKYFSLAQIFLLNLDLIGAQNQSSYSFVILMKSYVKEFVIFLPHALSIASLMLTTSLIFNYSKITNKFSPFIKYIILLFCIAFLTYRGFSYSSNLKYLIPAFCLPPLLFSIIRKDKFSIVGIVILTMALGQVAGTNTGLFLKLCTGFMVLLPISIIIIFEQKNLVFENISINTKVILIVGVSFILFFSLFARIGWIYHVDSGVGCRLRAIYPIDHKLMKGIYTTKKNASHIKVLCGAIESNIREDNTLFIYGHQPMFYYLTKHQPTIKKFWLVNNVIQTDALFFSIKENIKKTGKWPMIVDTKEKIMGESGENKLSDFFKENNYKIILEKDDFIIWNKMPI